MLRKHKTHVFFQKLISTSAQGVRDVTISHAGPCSSFRKSLFWRGRGTAGAVPRDRGFSHSSISTFLHFEFLSFLSLSSFANREFTFLYSGKAALAQQELCARASQELRRALESSANKSFALEIRQQELRRAQHDGHSSFGEK